MGNSFKFDILNYGRICFINNGAKSILMARIQKYKDFLTELIGQWGSSLNFDHWISRTREFAEQNEGTLDGIMGKDLLAGWLLAEGKINEVDTILKSLKLTGDDFVDYNILGSLGGYYYGFNDPSIDLTKAEEFRQKALDLALNMEFQDEWERVITTSSLLRGKIGRTDDRDEILDLIQEILENAKQFPKHGEKFYVGNLNDVGNFYARAGKLDLAIESYQTSVNHNMENGFPLTYHL